MAIVIILKKTCSRLDLLFVFCLLSIAANHSYGQSREQPLFGKNVIKFSGFKGASAYGYIIGGNAQRDSVFFIVISREKEALPHPENVLLSNENDNVESVPDLGRAGLIYAEPIQTGYGPVIYIYGAKVQHSFTKKFYTTTMQFSKGGYQMYTFDTKEDDDSEFNATLSIATISKVDSKSQGNLKFKSIQIVSVPSGFPVLTQQGLLMGITSGQKANNRKDFWVLDIATIRSKIMSLDANNPCHYFNLIEAGRSGTLCDSLDSLKLITKIEKQRLRSRLVRKQQRLIDYDENYDFAISVGGGSQINLFSMKNNSSNTFHGYQYNLNLHFNPDHDYQDGPRVTLMPSYTIYNGGPGKNNADMAVAGFKWTGTQVKVLELPIMFEYPSRFEMGDIYGGIGYSYGRQTSSKFTFSNSSNEKITEDIVGNQRAQSKIWIELGVDYQHFRLNAFSNYGLNSLLRSDYELILNGQQFLPFQDFHKHQFFFGINLSYRIWGRWQNGYRSLTIPNLQE